MRPVRYLFVHTAAADTRNVDAALIDRWHRGRGWSGIGYHYVILDDRHDTKPDGTVELGRAEARMGAHVKGANTASIGICCAGHGDERPLTDAQTASLIELLVGRCRHFGLSAEAVLGHREVNRLVERGEVEARYRTSKTCPGDMVDMGEIRSLVAARLREPTAAEYIARLEAENTRLRARLAELGEPV